MFKECTTALRRGLVSLGEFRPLPVYADRAGWEAIGEEQRRHFIAEGEKYLDYRWPTAPASWYMDFYRNGNRSRYQTLIYNERRDPLLALVAAECCEGKGRFIDDIINGVWTILEETTWVLPAHNSQYAPVGESPRALPDTENRENAYIDLCAAQYAAMMAWIYYTLGERLGEESPRIPARMLGEIERRIFEPFLQHRDFFWMGYNGRRVNNWNPWIVSNILTCAALACPREDRRLAVMEKCLECLDFFIQGYTPDGGCDEGPGYWNVAGASLFDCVDILYDVTGGQVDLFGDSLVRNICTYIYKMHISGKWFVNYADAQAVITPTASIIYRMGRRLDNPDLVKMGTAVYNAQKAAGIHWQLECPIYRGVKRLLVDPQLSAERDTGYPLVRDVWFPGIQVMAAREQAGSDKGLYLSAKGGCNGESHNHNDVGTFVLYCNGQPVMIDVGTGVYEKKTFSDRRYEIPQTRSLYHNLPIIGGLEQCPGREYAARDAAYTCTDAQVTFSLDLREAYPAEAGIESWRRSFVFDRKAGAMTLTDDFALREEKDVAFVLMTPVRPVFAPGEMTVPVEGACVSVAFDPALQPVTEPFETAGDARLSLSWGERAWRTVFHMPGTAKNGCYTFTFKQK